MKQRCDLFVSILKLCQQEQNRGNIHFTISKICDLCFPYLKFINKICHVCISWQMLKVGNAWLVWLCTV